MSGPGSPAQVQPGMVVRIRMGGSFAYTSRRLTREEAKTVGRYVRQTLRAARSPGVAAQLVDLDEFPADALEELAVYADKVTAVEVRCVNGDGHLVQPSEDGAP